MDEPPSNTLFLVIFSGQNLIYTVSFVAIVVLLLMSAMISASEVAFFSLKPDDLDRCRQNHDPREKTILKLLTKPRVLLATILIMNNSVNVGVVTFAATFVITFFGEIIPKVYAAKNNMVFARLMANTWKVVITLCKPISTPLLAMSNVVEKRFEKKGYQTTVEQLHQALDLATVNGETSADEKEILKGIVNFGTLAVKQVMRSRMDISATDIELNFHELMDWVNKSGFSRIPVYRETVDRIEGVLYIKDLLPFLDQDAKFEWQKLLRPGYFVPETKKIDSLLKDFQEKRVHMALVVDEYGGTSGLITLEDIIEEIIGDINDEFDEVGVNFQKIDEKTFVFEGRTSLHDFCKVIDVESTVFDSVKRESESLGGLILELNNELPRVGDEISHEQFTFTIEAVDRKTIKRVRVDIHEQEES